MLPLLFTSVLKCKPLNVITLASRETDNIDWMKTKTEQTFELTDCKKAK